MSVVALEFTSVMRTNEGDSILVDILDFVAFAAIAADGLNGRFIQLNFCSPVPPRGAVLVVPM